MGQQGGGLPKLQSVVEESKGQTSKQGSKREKEKGEGARDGGRAQGAGHRHRAAGIVTSLAHSVHSHTFVGHIKLKAAI